MLADREPGVRAEIETVYRSESRFVLATLIRLLGDFDLAEEALHEAFVAALQRWPSEGTPQRPREWLVSAGRFKGVDAIRRRARFDSEAARLADRLERADASDAHQDHLPDDRLRLVFTCCHPQLPEEARIALTLREVCGLTTEAIARAFLVSASTMAQRIVRAKARIRDSDVPYEVPGPDALPARLDAVLRTVYLVFNEGYASSAGEDLVRADLCAEALRLGELVVELLPDAEAIGLLALMTLHHARRAARTSDDGDLVLLDDQDRSRWDRDRIAEGCALVERALRSRRFGSYTLQAAIAAVHAESRDASSTDWPQIVGLYDLLSRIDRSPIVALNRAVAVGMRDGAENGLRLIDGLMVDGRLDGYLPAHAARADLCRRVGRTGDARDAYRRALDLARQEPERRFLSRRLRELDG